MTGGIKIQITQFGHKKRSLSIKGGGGGGGGWVIKGGMWYGEKEGDVEMEREYSKEKWLRR